MTSADFAGETARLYAGHRRDLPADQAAQLAEALALRPDDLVVDLGCGTGQLTAALLPHCAGVLAIDPEPGMLAGLRARALAGVVPVLGSDRDLGVITRVLRTGVGAVVVGNALHWMDERAALAAAIGMLRPGGGIAVVTQGPPLWLGPAGWQQQVRAVLERRFGPLSSTCGSDDDALTARLGILREAGRQVEVLRFSARHRVDVDWVIGHLGSALPAGALQSGDPAGLAAALRHELADAGELVEEVATTALVAR